MRLILVKLYKPVDPLPLAQGAHTRGAGLGGENPGICRGEPDLLTELIAGGKLGETPPRESPIRRTLAREGYRLPAERLVLPFREEELPFREPPLGNSPEYRVFEEWLWKILTGYPRGEWAIDHPIEIFPHEEGARELARLDELREKLLKFSEPAEVCAEYD